MPTKPPINPALRCAWLPQNADMSGRVPPSSRAGKNRRGNPADDYDTRAAADLYERFTGHDPVSLGKVTVPDIPKSLACIGVCDGILYSTVRDGRLEKYIHKFKASDAPLFCVSPDGTQIVFVGGEYDFTERGIVDRTSKR